jgi:CheY-like chemotaxis protein
VKILLTEDDPIVAELYRVRLDREGHEVEIAVDGQMALERIGRDRPDLILLDIRMPRLSGLGVLEQVRQNPDLHAIPVVMLTNYSDPAQVQKCRDLGIEGYLLKSRTTPRQLADWIKDWEEKRGSTPG